MKQLLVLALLLLTALVGWIGYETGGFRTAVALDPEGYLEGIVPRGWEVAARPGEGELARLRAPAVPIPDLLRLRLPPAAAPRPAPSGEWVEVGRETRRATGSAFVPDGHGGRKLIEVEVPVVVLRKHFPGHGDHVVLEAAVDAEIDPTTARWVLDRLHLRRYPWRRPPP